MSSRRTIKAFFLSIFLHCLLAMGIIWAMTPSRPTKPEQIGSQDMDIDLVAPRLAPPLRRTAPAGKKGPSLQLKGSQLSTSAASPKQIPPTLKAHASPLTNQQHTRRMRPARTRRKQQGASLSPVLRQSSPAIQKRQRLPARAEKPTSLIALYASKSLPQDRVPVEVLQEIKAAYRWREQRRHQQMEKAQRQEQRIAAQLKALTDHSRRGRDGSPPRPVNTGKGAGSKQQRHGHGEQISQLGLRFYLSGRRINGSRVVQPPEPIELLPVRCQVTQLSISPAMVRLLVDRQGHVGLAYLKHSSTSKRFDQCAVRHVKAIRFKPGSDEDGVPLNVWVNIRVEPNILEARAGL